jgi:hypothetical protein
MHTRPSASGVLMTGPRLVGVLKVNSATACLALTKQARTNPSDTKLILESSTNFIFSPPQAICSISNPEKNVKQKVKDSADRTIILVTKCRETIKMK